jgi:hypothetical protein
MSNTMHDGTWRKPAISAHNGGCAEVQKAEDGGVNLRNSTDPSKAAHHFTRHEWDCFMNGAKNGEFDLA